MGAYDSFIQNILPYAKQVENTYGIPTSVTIGQAIHESAGGTRTPNDVYSGKESYNIFGIKGSGNAGSVKSWTWEVYNGVKTKIVANFRAYSDWGGSLMDYGKLLSNDRYKPAFSKSNPYEFVEEIRKAGYATDPAYTKGVTSIMKSYNLTQYDGKGFSGNAPDPSNSNSREELEGVEAEIKARRKADTLFHIPIPTTDGITITKTGMFSSILLLVGLILLVMTLASMFLSKSPISSIVKGAISK